MNQAARILLLSSFFAACEATPRIVSGDGLEAELLLTTDWKWGYCASVTVTNRTRAPSVGSWTLDVDIGEATLDQISHGKATGSGTVLSITPSTNAPLLLGEATTFEFCASKTGSKYRPKMVTLKAKPAITDHGTSGERGGGAGGGLVLDELGDDGGIPNTGGGNPGAGGGSSRGTGGGGGTGGGISSGGGGSGGGAPVAGGGSAAGGGGSDAGTASVDAGVVCNPPLPGSSGKNPLFTDQFTADPSVLVDNCTFYIQCGHDEAAVGQNAVVMREWFLLSSTDMVHWTKSVGLRLATFAWANANSGASQIVRARNGNYYWYVSVQKSSDNSMAIGVATATSPAGPWTDALGHSLIDDAFEMSNMGFGLARETPSTIDPTVLIDDDDQVYLHYGGGWRMVVTKLHSNMVSVSGAMREMSPGNFYEGPALIKHNNLYYEIYAAASLPARIDFSTSTSPLGPWTYGGMIVDSMPRSSTDVNQPSNHPGVGELAGQWYLTYYISNGPNGGGTYRREVAVDKLTFNANGSIQSITPSTGLRF